MDFCERFGVWDWMCSTQSDSPPPPQQRPTLMSCVCTPSADDGAGPLCKMSPPESAAAALSASIPDPSSAVPDPAPSSPVFVLLALTETEEECHSPPPSAAVRSASSPSASSSSSSSSSSSDSAIASSSLLSSPTQNGVVARAASPSLCTSSSTGVSVLHVAHQSVDGGTWEPVGPVQHLRMDLHNAMDQLQKMANLVAHRAVLFCSREAIRQSIYPLCANAMLAQLAAEEAERCGELRQDVQLFSARLPLPSLFHAFVPFSSPCDVLPSIVPSSESAVEVNGGGGEETPTEPMECGGAELRRQLEERIRRMGAKLRERGESAVAILSRLDRVAQGYTPAVCSEMHVDSRCVVRARGLPWHVSDLDVALFFAGLDIPPGGIALCLGPEGRRSGEALVRFSRADQRELALQRHRRHLHARYIEVYRASGDEFVKHAVGTDSQAVRFALRAETAMAMIVRMRGLPFTATEQQVRDFFSSDGQPSGLLDQPGAVLFVHRPDGRPSGDAFVLFGDEQSGRRALAKHRQRMGGRYIELFRTTQAEVQQLFNARAIAQQNAAIAAAMNKLGAVVPLTTVQQSVLTPASPTTAPAALSGTAAGAAALPAQQRVPQQRQRDCLRLRGLPYEAQVQQVVEFLGPHARQVLFQGVHMIYNSAGHPSGEAFIQMESEQAAAQAALEMHNKYMELGKKRRYIEVFQCCSEDMSLLLNVLPPPSPVNGLLPPPPLTPTGGPPALFPMSTSLNPLGAGGGGAPSPSPLLAAFPVPPQFLAFPSPAAVSNGDPSMGGVLVAVSGQFAGPLVQQLYAAAPPPPDATAAHQFAHHSAVPTEFWLRNMAALRNGAAAIAAPTPLLPFHHHQLHTLPPFANGGPPPASISFAAAPTEVVAVQQPT